jgi:hypothetical protein
MQVFLSAKERCRVSFQPRRDREPVNAGFSFSQGEIGSQLMQGFFSAKER